jgi:hypothetical protein
MSVQILDEQQLNLSFEFEALDYSSIHVFLKPSDLFRFLKLLCVSLMWLMYWNHILPKISKI